MPKLPRKVYTSHDGIPALICGNRPLRSCLAVALLEMPSRAHFHWIEAVGNLCFPAKADHRLQGLMERNSEGHLQPGEKEELEALVELSEQMALVRAEALQILGKRPE